MQLFWHFFQIFDHFLVNPDRRVTTTVAKAAKANLLGSSGLFGLPFSSEKNSHSFLVFSMHLFY